MVILTLMPTSSWNAFAMHPASLLVSRRFPFTQELLGPLKRYIPKDTRYSGQVHDLAKRWAEKARDPLEKEAFDL